MARVQAFHYKGGQGAKTGTGGHLHGDKVQGRIAEVRGLQPGEAAVSPATFPDLHDPVDFRRVNRPITLSCLLLFRREASERLFRPS